MHAVVNPLLVVEPGQHLLGGGLALLAVVVRIGVAPPLLAEVF
jgi:hypothetical protein